MLVEEYGAKLGESFGWVFERSEDDGALVDRERQECDAVVDRLLEPAGKRIGPSSANHLGEVFDGVVGDG